MSGSERFGQYDPRMTGGRDVVIGISADFHDAAAAVLIDGELVAAAAEERFTRRKHDPSLPRHAAMWCLDEAAVTADDRVVAVFHEKPLSVWERIVTTGARTGPRGFTALREAIPQWTRSKLWIGYRIAQMFETHGIRCAEIRYSEHHQSHSAAAYYASPFERAAILTFDGVGEWATSTVGWGAGNRIEIKREQRFPHSLGLFYSTITSVCGFAVNDDEYKLMGLAPYGSPRFSDVLRDRVIRIDDDGAVTLDQRWFDYRSGRRMAHPRLVELLGSPAPPDDGELTELHADIARSAQEVIEEAILRSARFAQRLTGERAVCLAGGVALNCVANTRLRRDGPFDEVWVQPAAGDDGSAIGAAFWSWHQIDDRPREPRQGDRMASAALGPAYTNDEIAAWLEDSEIEHERFDDVGALVEVVARALAAGSIVGWFRGRMEFGPRALGNRSILADSRDSAVIDRLNRRTKGRESFRPFAPAVLAEAADRWFDLDGATSPYMVFTAPVSGWRPRDDAHVAGDAHRGLAAQLRDVRSGIPACTHVDGSARVQTVDAETRPDFHRLIAAFGNQTGVPVVLNTSFNRAGEPIVRTPADALRCFRAANLDLLVLEGCVIRATEPEEAR